MPEKPFTLGLVQMAMGRDAARNLDRAEALTRQAAREGAQVVCLPELFLTPYFCQREDAALFDLAEPIPGPSTERLGAVAKDCGCVVIASLFERRAPGLCHNTVAVLGTDGRIMGLYRKMHIPDDPAFYEKFYFTPGDLGFKSFDTPFGRIGVLICWDQWYPEAARITALTGASVIFYPTAIGWHPAERETHGEDQREAWITVQRGHAVANGVYVAAVNRVGHEIPETGGDGLVFWGSSFLAGPMGQMIAQADTREETILLAEVDPARIEETRRGWPFLRDRRIDAFGPILNRWLD
jgi:N-carbamoylputrescine amidase